MDEIIYLTIDEQVFLANASLARNMWKRGSSEGSDRFEYLQSLVTEFQDTDSEGRRYASGILSTSRQVYKMNLEPKFKWVALCQLM